MNPFNRFPPAISLLAVLFLVLAGCSSSPDPEEGAPRYNVRGVVQVIHGESSLVVHHEAIPDFRDRNGTIVGMAPMKMQFEAGPGVALEGIKPGDKVAMVVTVPWPALRILSIKTLPEHEQLEISSAP